MDPITIIANALAAGAAAGLKPTAEQVIKDMYASFKALIQSKYGALSLEALEQKPESETKRASVKEDLADADADKDNELLDRAKSLLDAVKLYEPSTAAMLKINFEEIEAAFINIRNAIAEGDVDINVKKGTFSGGINVEGLAAGTTGKK
jgi:hypothetical protein